ncbi:MAG: hypothetical protein KGL39_13040 [Patescibacteria group bacterium]|nr:hypothetical protein [Patescibacteria group bacterium]
MIPSYVGDNPDVVSLCSVRILCAAVEGVDGSGACVPSTKAFLTRYFSRVGREAYFTNEEFKREGGVCEHTLLVAEGIAAHQGAFGSKPVPLEEFISDVAVLADVKAQVDILKARSS